MENLQIRSLRPEDLEAIVEIDRRVLGEDRRDYWQGKLDELSGKASRVSFVVELEGRVVGFILGDVSGWEFGLPDTIGWIDTIGIDPSHQRRKLATLLVKEVIKSLKAVGVNSIYTLVDWKDWDLLQFFHTMGFARGDMINLELKI